MQRFAQVIYKIKRVKWAIIKNYCIIFDQFAPLTK
jgi:hypothetical protein